MLRGGTVSLTDYDDDTDEWCDVHAVTRSRCGCREFYGRDAEWEAWRNGIYDRHQLGQLPTPEPMIENTLDKRSVIMLAAPWGSGKTFLALDWSLCFAMGKPWQGRAIAPEGDEHSHRVLYVAAEGAYGLDQRITAWETAWQTKVDWRFEVLPRPIRLGTRQVPSLCRYMQDEAMGLLVIDTLARCSVGLDENSAKDMGHCVDDFHRMKDAMSTVGGSVLVVHHTGKDGKTVRGSSSLEGGVDTVYQIEGDSQAMHLKRTKRKDGPTPDSHHLKLQSVPGTDSVVVSGGRVDTTPTADRLVSTFVQAFSESGATKAELRAEAAMSSGSFHRALNRALQQGLLVNVGSEQRPFYRAGGEVL